ncbi:MAG: response regulator [Methanobacteriaceae archaeon]|nr:response regulator [Methanobacteriaceae archaeon]
MDIMTKILIVEDEVITASDLKNRLEDSGYTVVGMEVSGEKAIDTAAELRPDVVLMDINLKGKLTGIDAAKKILSLELPVIFLTAYDDKTTFEKANMNPPYGFIKKPFDFQNVIRTIELTINRSKIEAEKIDLARGLSKDSTDFEDKNLKKIAKNEYEKGVKYPRVDAPYSYEAYDKQVRLPSKIKVFIVEDEVITATDIKLTLEELGFEVVGMAVSANQAIDLITKTMPDLILMDIFIKGNKTGIEVTKELEYLNIPIIFLTANTDNAIASQAINTAPYGYLTKPLNKSEIEKTIEVALKKHAENLNSVYYVENKVHEKSIELKIEKTDVILIFGGSIVIIIISILTANITWLQYVLAIPAVAMITLSLASLITQEEPIPYEVDPYVTVVVPAHNEEFTIKKCVESLAAMDYNTPEGKKNFELIVVNDGSEDNTGKVLASLKPKYEHLRIITRVPPRSGKGKGFVLNDAFKLSKGEIIGVFDADTRVKPDYLTKIIPYLNDENVVGVQSRVKMYNEKENFLTHMQHLEFANFATILRAKDNLGKAGFLGGNGQFVKTESIFECEGWDGFAITEDLNLSVRLMIEKGQIRFCKEATVYQEAVSQWVPFLRQRSRWSIGNFETLFIYAPSILRAPIPFLRKMGIIEHVLWFGLNMLIFFGFLVFIANIIGWYLLDHTVILVANAPHIVGLLSAVGFIPCLLLSLHREKYSPFEIIKNTIGYWLYSFHLIPLFFMTFYSMTLRKERKWIKTEHKGSNEEDGNS